MVYVENLTSSRSGREVANQFVIYDGTKAVSFQSYKTWICTYNRQLEELEINLDYCFCSTTTTRYFKQFIETYTYYNYEALKKEIKKAQAKNISKMTYKA